ncbi:MAG: DUF4249 domain-containing protein [Ginsengibacter sp.]
MKKIAVCIIFFFVLFGCKEKFNTKIPSPATGYLVVEGFISSGQSATEIMLTRSVKLYDSVDVIPEHNAVVNIESETNELFPLSETGSGVYTSDILSLDDAKKYRLQIRTQDNKEYLSDFATFKKTPDIDSISWIRDDNGVKIYINTHDPTNNTRYYHWKFEETWEFHSTYNSSLIYIRDQNFNPSGVTYRNVSQAPDTTIFKCWKTVNSTNITIGSSEKLSKDVIYLPLVSIEPASVELSVLYSINVRQYALSHEAYIFFQKVKKNTESLGSIFDAQPSDLQGNIHCVTDPSEIVVGYIDISEEKIKRIFINNSELPGWGYSQGCVQTILDNQPDSILKYGVGLSPMVPTALGPFGVIVKFSATPDQNCIDCTLKGTNMRPSFWP